MSEHTTNPTQDHAQVVHHHGDMPEEHPERHEHSDVSVRGIWITVGAILLTALAVHVLLYVVFFAYEGAQARQDEVERRSAITDVVQGPPTEVPRLQGISSYNAETPSADLLRMRTENQNIVNQYGKSADGRLHIPVTTAIDLALKQNIFPARGGAATQPATTQPVGGSNAGH
jgi:hypothetical protein